MATLANIMGIVCLPFLCSKNWHVGLQNMSFAVSNNLNLQN